MPRKNGGQNEPEFERNRGHVARTSGGRFASMPASSVSWSGVSNQAIRDAVVAVGDAGASILLGRTSDGGAFVVQVYDGDDRLRRWPHSVEELESDLSYICDVYGTDG